MSTDVAEKSKDLVVDGGSEDETVAAVDHGLVVNASGYKDQLKRQYGLIGLAGIALTVDNAWVSDTCPSARGRENWRKQPTSLGPCLC